MEQKALLRIDNLSVHYGGIQALDNISLHIAPGEIVSLIGANGAGKTSLLRAISGMVPCQSSQLSFAGQSIDQLDTASRVRLGLAHSPEGRMVLSHQTVEDNLRLGGWIHRRHRAKQERALEETYELFPRLRERRQQLAGTLSGGEQQMLAIGRALMAKPRLLLLDEPSLGLAPLIVAEIFERMRELHAKGMALLLVEQNAQLALRLATRAYVLESGRLVLEGPAAQLLHDPKVQDAYLGA